MKIKKILKKAIIKEKKGKYIRTYTYATRQATVTARQVTPTDQPKRAHPSLKYEQRHDGVAETHSDHQV